MTVYNLAAGGSSALPYKVHYAPDHAPNMFYLSSGDARNGNGTYLSARQALEITWRGDLDSAGALWLVPILERMASGETVPVGEVLKAYSEIHGHKPTAEQWPTK